MIWEYVEKQIEIVFKLWVFLDYICKLQYGILDGNENCLELIVGKQVMIE